LVGDECEVEHVILEVAYMHMDPYKSVKNPIGQWYNTIWLLRWFGYTIFSHAFRYNPRTMFSLFIPINLGMIALAIMAKPHFNNSGIAVMCIVEEIFVFIWHIAIWILFLDQWRKDPLEHMGSGPVWGCVLTAMLSYFICMILEAILLKDALTETVKSDREENLNAQDIEIEELSNDEVNLRMQTYNKLKMGEIQPNKNSSTPGDAIRAQSELVRLEEEKLNEKKRKSNVKFNLGPTVGQN